MDGNRNGFYRRQQRKRSGAVRMELRLTLCRRVLWFVDDFLEFSLWC